MVYRNRLYSRRRSIAYVHERDVEGGKWGRQKVHVDASGRLLEVTRILTRTE